MASVHVTTSAAGQTKMVMHVDVPVGNNVAGLSWATALKQSGLLPGTTVLPDGDGTLGTISSAEKAALAAFTRVEIVRSFAPDAAFFGLTANQKGTVINGYFTSETTTFLAEMQDKLRYLGLVLP